MSAGMAKTSSRKLPGIHLQTPSWIDTICVPSDKPFKKLAIQKMKDTYEKVSQVLVLNSQLRKTCIGAPQNTTHIPFLREAAVKILHPGCMRRLWKFQEGRLAKRLSYQFADRIVHHLHIVTPLTILPIATNGFGPVATQAV